jgi:hypothetical protein
VGGEVYEEPITISVHCTDIGYSCQYAGDRGRPPGPEWGRTPHGIDDGRRSAMRRGRSGDGLRTGSMTAVGP